MKKLSVFLFINAIFSIFLIGCGSDAGKNFFGPSAGDSETGSLVIDVSMVLTQNQGSYSVPSDYSILPDISMVPATYMISGSGPSGSNLLVTSDEEIVIVEDLVIGDWEISVSALNSEGAAIARGLGVVSISASATQYLDVTVVPLEGPGSLNLAIHWEGTLQNPVIESVLVPYVGDAIELDFILEETTNSATCSAEGIEAGYYSLMITIYDGDVAVAGVVDVVRIISGETTTAAITFDELNNEGDIDINMDVDMNEPLMVTLSGQLDSLYTGGTMTVSAFVENADEVTFRWYLNGNQISVGSSITFGDSLSPGVYRLDVVALTLDGQRSGNATHTFRVLENTDGDTWTILVHLAIDNNIDWLFETDLGIVGNYLSTLEAVEAADTAGKVEILVMMDGSNAEGNFNDGYYHLTGGDFSSDLAVDLVEINSGSPADTQAFMEWAVANYPSSHYIYSVFNHGSGFDDYNIDGTSTYLSYPSSAMQIFGIGFDESHDDDSLSHHELGLTTGYLKQLIGKKIDLVFTYACLMGGMELAYEIRNNADYLLFSEELYPADKWSYEALSSITNDPAISARDVGIAFCDSAFGFFSGLPWPRAFTLSLIDLAGVDSLSDALSSYAAAAMAEISANPETAIHINEAADDSFTMMSDLNFQINKLRNYYYMDIGDYCDNIIASPYINETLKSEAEAVKLALAQCVEYSRSWAYPHASGMTVFHNIWSSNLSFSTLLYEQILDFGSTSWSHFISAMGSAFPVVGQDEYESDGGTTTLNAITPGETQDHTFHYGTDVDYIRLDLSSAQPGSTYQIVTSYLHTSTIDTRLQVRNASNTVVVENDDSGASTGYSRLIWTCQQPGVYYIRINEFNGKTGYYRIAVIEVPALMQDSYESDNDDYIDTTTNSMVPGDLQYHTLHEVGDPDFIRLDLSGIQAGTEVKIETYFLSLMTDTLMALYDSDYNVLALDDNSGGGAYSRVVYKCAQPGIYYVVVFDYFCRGDYTIDLQTGTFNLMYTPGIGEENRAFYNEILSR